jgi:hypothetical protein
MVPVFFGEPPGFDLVPVYQLEARPPGCVVTGAGQESLAMFQCPRLRVRFLTFGRRLLDHYVVSTILNLTVHPLERWLLGLVIRGLVH